MEKLALSYVVKTCDKPKELETWLEDYIKAIREEAKKINKPIRLTAVSVINFINERE